MSNALSTVSFIESSNCRLVFEGSTCANGMSGQGCFLSRGRTSQLPSPLPRVNTVRRYRSFLCRTHVEHHAMHSANWHRGMRLGAAPKLNWAACPRQSASGSGNSAMHTPSPSWLSVSRGQRSSHFLARSCLATLA
jgi:hypothetical protein